MIKTKRYRSRQNELLAALDPRKLESLWGRYVRSYLRNLPIPDLHDYYDFHINRLNRINLAIESVQSGTYQPSKPTRIRSEKKHGISRQIVFLYPEDALLLEAIGDFITPNIEKAQPSNNAYYSRNRQQPRSPTDLHNYFGYPWWILWPIFQKQIFKFTDNKQYVVVTDVSNYYDCIGFDLLRNYLSTIGEFSEVFLDFLFYMLERFVWRPDYLPFPGKGLPQINLDAPRLLAHSFLFEVDNYLKEDTQDNFARWMDDITFGCDNKTKAKNTLRNIDEILLSRGLHLNSSKTAILDINETKNYFWVDENIYLSVFQNRLKRLEENGEFNKFTDMSKRLRKRFRGYKKKKKEGYWNKILKRYYNIASNLGDPFLDTETSFDLNNQPDTRETIFRYYRSIGWSKKRKYQLIKYLLRSSDDEGFFFAIKLLLDWRPNSTVKYIAFMRRLAFKLSTDNPIRFIGSLWLLAKFGRGEDIDKLLQKHINLWKYNDWIARQVASVKPRMQPRTLENVENISQSFGLSSTKLVLDNLSIISSDINLYRNKVRPFIMSTKINGDYPLPKLLIALSLLQGNYSQSDKDSIRLELLKIVDDPIYRFYIKRGY